MKMVPVEAGGGGAGNGFLWWGSRRSAAFDGLLALASGAEAAFRMAAFGDGYGVPVWLSAAAGALVGLTLVLRRRYPVPLVLLSSALAPTEAGTVLWFGSLYSMGAYCRARRPVLVGGALALAAALLTMFVVTAPDQLTRYGADASWPMLLTMGLMVVGLTVSPVLLGLYVAARRRLVAGLQEKARTLELEQRLLAEQARQRTARALLEERARIAREMHDVVAHRVSLMVVHAGAIAAVAPRDSDAAVRSAVLLGDVGRQALDELRQILGVLRMSDGPSGVREVDAGAGAGSGGDGGSDTDAGEPVLAGLDELVGQSRAAGMVVELLVGGESRRLPEGVESAAFRLVQEGLTNAHKHAGSAAVKVEVAYGPGELAVTVRNECPPDGAGSAGLPSGGNGLRGMAERVRAAGGEFRSGADRDGGFTVAARFPVGVQSP